MAKKTIAEKKNHAATKKNTNTIYLIINIFAFMCCWVAAMGFISWFDSPIYMVIVFATTAGYIQGGLREIINLVLGIFSLVLSWFLAVWLTNILGFGFFMAKLHHAYIFWFVCISFISIISTKKLINFLMSKCHKQKWLRAFSFRLGLPVGLAKGTFLAFLFLFIVYYSGFLITNFPKQVEKSLFLKNFIKIEKTHNITAKIDLFNVRNSIYDTESRWKFYDIIGRLYPYQYQKQQKALDILLPLIFNQKHLSHFYKTKDGKKLLKVLKKLPDAQKMWKKNTNNIRDLKKSKQTPRKILIFLHLANIQKVLQTKEVKDFLNISTSKN